MKTDEHATVQIFDHPYKEELCAITAYLDLDFEDSIAIGMDQSEFLQFYDEMTAYKIKRGW
jgi:hypothetical protein